MAGFLIRETDWARDVRALSAIRRAVFIDEQGVPEALEWDEHDAGALHLLAIDVGGIPIGCARLLRDDHLCAHIGRMAVLPAWRGRGVGRALLAAALRAGQGHDTLRLSAQIQAVGLYAAAGFVTVGEVYEEAGIPHIAMQFCPR